MPAILSKKSGKDQVRLRPDGLPQINNTPHVGPEPHGSAWVSLILANEDGVRDRQQPHQCAMLQELEDLWLICETPVNRQNKSIIGTSHRQPQNCHSTKYQSKGTHTLSDYGYQEQTSSPLTKELRMHQRNKKPDKQSNTSVTPTLQGFQLYFTKKVLTCQCRSSPPEGPVPVAAAWWSAEEALTSKTSPVSSKAHREISTLHEYFLLQVPPLFLQQMEFTKILKVMGELRMQQQYNKSWSNRIQSHSMELPGIGLTQIKQNTSLQLIIHFWGFDQKSKILPKKCVTQGKSLLWKKRKVN